MPTSELSNITTIMKEVGRLNPRSVIDCGIGFGKYGALCREYLDIAHRRITPEQWAITIDGIEAFEPYRNPVWGAYSRIDVGEFQYQNLNNYDLALVIDSLEHLPEEEGAKFLQYLLRHCKNMIVSCPDGDYPQGAVNGNEYERHRARWSYQKFAEVVKRPVKILHQEVCIVVSIRGDL